MNEEHPIDTRVRFRAALAVLEDIVSVLDEHPGWINAPLEEQRKLERKLSTLKHRAQRELLIAWRKEEI